MMNEGGWMEGEEEDTRDEEYASAVVDTLGPIRLSFMTNTFFDAKSLHGCLPHPSAKV